MNEKKNNENGEKINIAITFYGGVSLAVYEAGVAEEFLRFIQFCNDPTISPGIKKPKVGVSVLSGASAGGLAAIMMSAALLNSNDPSKHIQEMRRIWFDVADISNLLYARGESPVSFLNNDILEDEIKKFLEIEQGRNGLCEDLNDLKVLLTATNMQGYFDAVPIEEHFVAPGKYAVEAFPTIRHTEVFSFGKDEIQDSANRERIAKAARITSSFPVAFPPQWTQSPGLPLPLKTAKNHNAPAPPSFWYFDGGVLDNKPLGHAVDHIGSSAKEGDWWYFFIEPKPEGVKPWHEEYAHNPKNPPDPSAAVWNVLEVVTAESIYSDLRRIQKMNHQIMQAKTLLSDMWAIHKERPDKVADYCKRLDDNVKTARLHRFLPDYVKCVTMLFYRFKDCLKEKKNHDEIINSLLPLDLQGILNVHPPKNHQENGNDKTAEEEIKKISEEIRAIYKEISKEDWDAYNEASDKVKETQLRFRQIAFWVEDDFTKEGKDNEEKNISKATWEAFEEEQNNLLDGARALAEVYKKVVENLEIAKGQDAVEKIKCFSLLQEAIHAASGLETREPIRVVRIYHNAKKDGNLAGAKLANFSGFLDRRWRKHDYLMGMKDVRAMLKKKMDAQTLTSSFWPGYDEWRKGHETSIVNKEHRLDEEELNSCDMELENLPAGKVTTVLGKVLRTFSVLIGKYHEKSRETPPYLFFLLEKMKFRLTLLIARFLIWLVKQATAQPSCRGGGKDASTMARFFSGGKRYVGFMLMGIIIGLIISFFLPDAVRAWAPGVVEYIYHNAKKILNLLWNIV